MSLTAKQLEALAAVKLPETWIVTPDEDALDVSHDNGAGFSARLWRDGNRVMVIGDGRYDSLEYRKTMNSIAMAVWHIGIETAWVEKTGIYTEN